MEKLNGIAIKFDFGETVKSIVRFGSGHINDTYLVDTTGKKFILQKVNTAIFKNIENLTSNILVITDHYNRKIATADYIDLSLKPLYLIPCKDGNYFFRDDNNGCWRMFNYIENSICYDRIDSEKKAYNAAHTFGLFQKILSDLDPKLIHEIIPEFHNMKSRYQKFLKVVKENHVNRLNSVKKEVQFVENRIAEMISLQQLIDDGKIPVRISHNDTKINNILFDKNDNALCVIDLDIVMPGSVLFDFGDAIRTGAAMADEDEQDLTKVGIDIGLFEAYVKGYLYSTKQFLVSEEISNLAFSAKYMTFIMGLRFLTDYLDGDKYYKIHHSNHNLHRVCAQFRQVEILENNFEIMKGIVQSSQ